MAPVDLMHQHRAAGRQKPGLRALPWSPHLELCTGRGSGEAEIVLERTRRRRHPRIRKRLAYPAEVAAAVRKIGIVARGHAWFTAAVTAFVQHAVAATVRVAEWRSEI